MKRALSLFTLLIFSALAGYTQVVTIQEAVSGSPLELVSVSSRNPFAFTNTNAQGQVDISQFKESAEIEFRLLGYKNAVKSYEEIERSGFVVVLNKTAVNLDAIVVSANRWEQSSQNTPSHIILIKPKDLELLNPQTAADLLGTSGEVFIQKSQQGGGSPMIRGFASNRLLYSIDGIRMNTAIYRAGNLQSVISLDPFAIQNTEVLFGSSSVMYGSDAIGAVMSFQTLKPQLSFSDEALVKGSAATRYSSANNEKTGHFDVNVGWKKWAMLSSVSYHNFGELKMGSHGPDDYLKTYYTVRMDSLDHFVDNPDPRVQIPTAYDQFNIMQKVRFKPNESWNFQYAFHYSETSDYGRYDKHIETKGNLPKYALWNYGPQKWMMNNFNIEHSGNNAIFDNMSIKLAQQGFEESRISRDFSGNKSKYIKTQLEEVKAYSVNADFEKTSGEKHSFYYGLEYVTNNVKSTGTGLSLDDGASVRVDDRYPQADWSSYALYLNYMYRISRPLSVQAGARFSSYNVDADFTRFLEVYPFGFSKVSLNNNSTTWSLGLVYATEKWQAGLNGSSGFRAPNVDDIGKITEYESGEVVVPNPKLESEYSYHGELNVARAFGDFLKINISGYYTYLDKAMVRDGFQVNGMDSMLYNGVMSRIYAIQNAQSAYVYGTQVGVELKLPQGFSILSKLNYQHGEEDRGVNGKTPIRYVPPTFGLTRLSFQKNRLEMQVYASYCGGFKFEEMSVDEQRKPTLFAKDENGNPYTPSWATLNFQALYHLPSNITVTAGIENITDKRYRVYRSGIASAGRNFVFSLRTNF